MPVYEFSCECGNRPDIYLRLADYQVPQFCKCGKQLTRVISPTMISVDIPAYISPASGKLINSRAQRKEDMKATGCVDYEPSLKKYSQKVIEEDEKRLDKLVDETVEREIHSMPAKKREKLISELDSGASLEYTRQTATA